MISWRRSKEREEIVDYIDKTRPELIKIAKNNSHLSVGSKSIWARAAIDFCTLTYLVNMFDVIGNINEGEINGIVEMKKMAFNSVMNMCIHAMRSRL